MAGDEAQALLDRFDERVPYVRATGQAVSDRRPRQRGYIVTLLGRRCRFPQLSNGSYDWTHKALNRLIQGSSGDQTKAAVVALDRAGVTPQLQVHDEVCGCGDMARAKLTKEIMEHCVELNVPSRVDLEVGPSWGEAA